MVSAWSSVQKLVLGARATDEKSNEITAIPELLDLLALKGAIVTIDAMGCQKKIAKKAIDKGADYVLGLKGNQGTLRDDVELLFTEQMACGFKDVAVSRASSCDAEHGRMEIREAFAVEDIAWLKQRHDWKGLRSIVAIVSSRETAKGKEQERRFYISSLSADADKLASAIRAHWGVENSLHWVLDVNFRDDDCRIRKKNAPANLTAVKRAAINALRKAPGSRGGCPFERMSRSPSGPCWLKRWTQSRRVWRSIPPIRAACSRSIPSSTAASDNNRRL